MQNKDNNNIFFIDEINNLENNDKDLLISMSEEMYHEQINELVLDIIKRKTIKIVLLAGPSSSGKTTTSKLISKALEKYNKKSVFVSLDDFFLDRDKTPKLPNGKYDFESLRSIDLTAFNNFLNELTTKKTAPMPRYDFITGKRIENDSVVNIDDNSVIIIEGLHALNPALINNHKSELYKVYICVMSNFYKDKEKILSFTELRLMRRLIRDYYSRGRTIKMTLETWQEVLDGEKENIDPYKNEADYFVDSTHMYEPLLYANYLISLLDDNNEEEKQLKNKLKNFNKIDKNVIPKNSLLSEFIKL